MRIKMHNERCRDCKEVVNRLLYASFGRVEVNKDLNLPCRLEDYKKTTLYETLAPIHMALQKHRGYKAFVKAKKLPRFDYFIPDQKIIVEFDESQHFTKPRAISLDLYPDNREYGFSIKRWRYLCNELDKRDNDPPYRDEQRAWYDTLRDFAPQLAGTNRTVRLFSRDYIWCSLDPSRESDLLTFEKIMNKPGR